MKRTIYITLLLLFITTISNAQFATYDAANHTSQLIGQNTRIGNFLKNSKILVEAVKTVKGLKEIKDTYESIDEELRTVKSVIQTGREIAYILNAIEDLSQIYTESVNNIAHSPYLDAASKEFIIEVYTKELELAISQFDKSDKIVSNSIFKMNDAERLNFLENIRSKIDDHKGFLLYFNAKLRYAQAQKTGERSAQLVLANAQNFLQ